MIQSHSDYVIGQKNPKKPTESNVILIEMTARLKWRKKMMSKNY